MARISAVIESVERRDPEIAQDTTGKEEGRTGNLISLVGVGKRYVDERQGLPALQSIDLEIDAGEFVAIMGASGSGKTTLLSAIGGMNTITEGKVLVDGVDIHNISGDRQADYRNAYLGFIFQQHHLLSHLTAQENVLLAAAMNNPDGSALAAASLALERVGLADKAHRLPGELSGGEQARVAIARCLMRNPPIVLADEPTGSLDSKTGYQVLSLLEGLNAQGHTVIMVTHSEEAARSASRVVRLSDGRIIADERKRVARQNVPATARPQHSAGALVKARQAFTGARRTTSKLVSYIVALALTLQVLLILYLIWEGLTNGAAH